MKSQQAVPGENPTFSERLRTDPRQARTGAGMTIAVYNTSNIKGSYASDTSLITTLATSSSIESTKDIFNPFVM